MDIIFKYLRDGIIGNAGVILNYMSQASIDLFSNDLVLNILALFQFVGWILLAVGILFAIANMYIEYLESSMISVHLLIINILEAIVAIYFINAGTIAVYDLSNTLNEYVAKIASTPDYSTQMSNINNTLSSSNELSSIWILIIGIVALVAIIVCLVQIMKRGGMYMAQIIIGYLYVFSIPSGNIDGFMEWCKQTVAIALTNVVQTALLFIGLSLMANDITKIFLGIGVILGASSVEKVAGRYGLSANASKHMRMRPFNSMGSYNFGGTATGGNTGGSAYKAGATANAATKIKDLTI